MNAISGRLLEGIAYTPQQTQESRLSPLRNTAFLFELTRSSISEAVMFSEISLGCLRSRRNVDLASRPFGRGGGSRTQKGASAHRQNLLSPVKIC